MEIVSEYSNTDDLYDKLNIAYLTINELNIELKNYMELIDKIEREQTENIQHIIKIKEENKKLKEQNQLLNKVIDDKKNLVELNNNLILENENLININKQLLNKVEELNKETNLLKEFNYIEN